MYDADVKTNPTKSEKYCQEHVIKKWDEIKNDYDLPSKVNNLLTQFKAVAMQKKELLGDFGENNRSRVLPKRKTMLPP